MRISAKADYAVRAALVLAQADETAVTAEDIARAQAIPVRFLEAALRDLRRAGLVASRRGPRGGHRLSRSSAQISIAQVVRAIDGPLVFVNGERPSDLEYSGTAAGLLPVWVAVRVAVRQVLDEVTLADVLEQRLMPEVQHLLSAEGAWDNEPPS
ncbi:MAG: Rrf2 family transcriptional regulator [Ornithinimicrobium sp.]